MRTRKVVKVVGKHVKGCAGVRSSRRGDWPTPWGPIAWGDFGSPVVKTRSPRGQNVVSWVQFVCNDTQCHARLYVSEQFILASATKKRGDR